MCIRDSSRPAVVELAPGRDAVEISGDRRSGKLLELMPGKFEGFLDEAAHREAPPLGVERGDGTLVKDRPLESERLARG